MSAEGKTSINLSVSKGLKPLVEGWVASHRRKGMRNVSQLTENLWRAHLRKKKVKLPPELKNGK